MMDRIEVMNTLAEEIHRLEILQELWERKKAGEGIGKTIASLKIEQCIMQREQTFINMKLLGFTEWEITVAMMFAREREADGN